MTMTVHPIRATGLVAASGAGAWWLAEAAVGTVGAPATLESLVTAAVLIGGAAAAAMVSLTTMVALAQGLAGRRPRAAEALPAPLRRLVVGAVAAAVAAGAALPANAEDSYPGWAPTVPTATASATPTPEPSPAPPSSPADPSDAASSEADPPGQAEPEADASADDPVVELHAELSAPALPEDGAGDALGAARGAAAGSASVVHVVMPGESLWSIARDALAPGATDADIASAWPLIYSANRAIIGGDAGLIRPGQELAIPGEVAA